MPSTNETDVDTYFSYLDDAHGAPTVVVIGNFDGLHRGHMTLLRTAHTLARDAQIGFSVLTFSPHPARVLAPHRAPPSLMSDIEKATAFRRLGVDAVWFQQFTTDFADLSPRSFVEDVLKAGLGAVHVVVGFDFRFGQGRAGTTETLRELLVTNGMRLTVIEAVQDGVAKVSSSAIREAMTYADIERVNALLGWSYAIEGLVIRGDARGRTIDFPTLNIQLGEQLYPSEGVYCGWLESGDKHLAAVANLGARPTVGDARTAQLEVHVMGTDLGDMYDRPVRFVFHSKIRRIERFDDLNALRDQIAQDVVEAQRALAGVSPAILSLS